MGKVVRMSAEEMRSMPSETDWERVDAMVDEDIDYSDCPPMSKEWFAKAREVLRVKNKGKSVVSIRLDNEVLDWFKEGGRGYQTRINHALRMFIDADNGGR